MSVKLKFILVLILSVFATAAGSVYMLQYQTAMPISDSINTQPPQELSAIQQTQAVVEDLERAQYQSIPLENFSSPLQGTDPKTLAINFLDDLIPTNSDRKIEVVYSQPHQALVTVMQKPFQGSASAIMKYRLEMDSFGRSLFSNSPPIWRIVWVGSQLQCPVPKITRKGNPKSPILNPQLKTPTNQAKGGFDHCQEEFSQTRAGER